jgi:hypothetical protein
MRNIQETYEMYDKNKFFKKCLTALVILVFTGNRKGNYLIMQSAKHSGKDKEDYLVSFVRGFKPG